MARSAKPRKRKSSIQRSKHPRHVVKLHEDEFFDEEEAEVLRFEHFDDAVECCADLNRGPLGKREISHAKTVFCTIRYRHYVMVGTSLYPV